MKRYEKIILGSFLIAVCIGVLAAVFPPPPVLRSWLTTNTSSGVFGNGSVPTWDSVALKWKPGSGGNLTSNANQFLGVPLSLIRGAKQTNGNFFGNSTNHDDLYVENFLHLNSVLDFNNFGTAILGANGHGFLTWSIAGELDISGVDGHVGIFITPDHAVTLGGVPGFTSYITNSGPMVFNSGLVDNFGSLGSAGKILTSTGTGISWSNSASLGLNLTTNGNQFLGVPLSIKSGVDLTNAQNFGTTLIDGPQTNNNNIDLNGAVTTWDGAGNKVLSLGNNPVIPQLFSLGNNFRLSVAGGSGYRLNGTDMSPDTANTTFGFGSFPWGNGNFDSLTVNTNIILVNGWQIYARLSESESTITNYELVLKSMPPINGPLGGDGLLKLESNLTPNTNAMFLSFKGDLYSSKDGSFSNSMKVIQISLVANTIVVGGPSNSFTRIASSNAFWNFNGKTQIVDNVGNRLVDGDGAVMAFNPDLAYAWQGPISNATFSSGPGASPVPLFPMYHSSTNGATIAATDFLYCLGNIAHALTATGVVMTNGNIRLTPFWSGAGGQFDVVGVRVSTLGSSTLRYGIYQSQSTTNFMPGSLVANYGTFDNTTTGFKFTNLVNKIRLKPATIYWAGASVNDGTAGVTSLNTTVCGSEIMGFSTNNSMQISLELVTTYGAWPASAPLTNFIVHTSAEGAMCPAVFVRSSSP